MGRCVGSTVGGPLGVAVVVVTVLAPAALHAQQTVGAPGDPLAPASQLTAPQANRPFRGLFGPGRAPRTSQQLDLTVAVFGGRTDVLGARQPTDAGLYQRSSNSAGANAVLQYAALLSKVSLNAFGGASMSSYFAYEAPVQVSYVGGVGATATLGRRTTVNGSQSVSYSPFMGLFPFAGLLPLSPADVIVNTPSDDYAVGPGVSLGLSTTARITHILNRYTSLAAFFTMNRVTFSTNPDFMTRTAGLSFHRGLTRHSSFRAGYAYQDGDYGNPAASLSGPTGNHDVNLGVDYGRSLSPWRRTTITFGTGSSLARRLDSAEGAAEPANHPLAFVFTGFAALNRELGRSWNVRGTFRRSMAYVPGFGDPFLSDAVSGAAGGEVGRRLHLSAMVAGSRGSVGLAPSGVSAVSFGNNFWAYTASARAQYAITRHLAAYTNYLYYNYLFGSSVTLPSGLGRGSARQSIQAGLTTWWPIFRR